MSQVNIFFHEEVKLMGYGESDSSGCWVKIEVMPDDLQRFRGMKGERFYMTLVQIGADEVPVQRTTEGVDWVQTAVMVTKNPKFVEYTGTKNEQEAIEWLREKLGVASRSELSANPTARARLKDILRDFNLRDT